MSKFRVQSLEFRVDTSFACFAVLGDLCANEENVSAQFAKDRKARKVDSEHRALNFEI